MNEPACFGRFVVHGRIGVGGMGEVFRARGDEGAVALKLMRPELATDAHHRKLFLVEASLGKRLLHPNLVRQYDAGESRGTLWLALELVDGLSLARVLKAGALSPSVAAYVMLELLAALAYVHDEGLVHRDVSAANVLVSRRGAVKLSDFGVAKAADLSLTRTNEEKGKPAYMAPEQLGGRDSVDGRVDLFAAGVLLYRMTMGAAPFTDVAEWLRDGCPLAPRGPLAAIVTRAMAPDREHRFADARAMADALRALLPPRPDAAAELGVLVQRGVEAAEAIGDLDRLVMAAFGGETSRRERTAVARRGDTISGELAVGHDASLEITPGQRGRRVAWARRLLPALAVASALALALLAPRRARPHLAEPPPRPFSDAALAAPTAPPVARATPPARLPRAPVASSARPATRERARPPEVPRGYLTLDTQPWGTVYLDGKRLGVTPFARVAVPAGRHRLSVDVQDSGTRRPLVVRVAPRSETQLVAQLR
jgi:serine/threonine-protein kinase